MEEFAALAEKLRDEGNKLADFLSGLGEHSGRSRSTLKEPHGP